MKRITDKSFVYTPACATDLKKRFDKERKRLAKLAELQAKFPPKVTQLKREAGK